MNTDYSKKNQNLDVSKENCIPSENVIKIRIGAIYDPSKFWFILDEDYEDLDKLMDSMQISYGNKGQNVKIREKSIQAGMSCVALYNGEYHRGVVKQVMLEIQEVSVFFMDYGILETVDCRELYYLTKTFKELPRQSIRARLSGVQPAVTRIPWSLESRDYFIRKVKDQILSAEICSVDEDTQISEVILTVNSISLNDELVKEGFAVYSNQLTPKAARPSFEKLEEEVVDLPLPQAELLLKFCKPVTVRESILHGDPIQLIFVHNKICISIVEMIALTQLENSSVKSIKEEIVAANYGENLYDVEIRDEKIKMKLRKFGIESENNMFNLIVVEFIPEFFNLFTDFVFPQALFERFLKEVYTLM